MKRESISFALAGILFGFVLGYVLSYQVNAPRVRGDEPRAADPQPGRQEPRSGDDLMAEVTGQIEHLKEHVAENPTDIAPLLQLGEIYYQGGFFAEAADYFGRVVDLEETHLDARTSLGICLVQLLRPDEALAVFQRSTEIDPGHLESWLNLGFAEFAANHDLEAAERAFAQVDRLEPGLPELAEIRRTLAEMAAGAGDF